MDRGSVLDDLRRGNSAEKKRALDQLRAHVKRDGLPVDMDTEGLFSMLNTCLADNSWSVSHQCLLLIGEIAPHLQNDTRVENHLDSLLPNVIMSLGSRKGTTRKAALNTLLLLMKYSFRAQYVNTLCQFGFGHKDARVRQNSALAIPTIVRAMSSNVDMKRLLSALIFRLSDDETVVVESVVSTIHTLWTNHRSVAQLILKLGYSQQQMLKRHLPVLMKQLLEPSSGDLTVSEYKSPRSPTLSGRRGSPGRPFSMRQSTSEPMTWNGGAMTDELKVRMDSSRLLHGFVPAHLIEQLHANRNTKEYRVRINASAQIDKALLELSDIKRTIHGQHLESFIRFLMDLVKDKHFKVVMTSLNMMNTLFESIGSSARHYLHLVLPALISKLGDNKLVVRIEMKIFRTLFLRCEAGVVMGTLLTYLADENWRIRLQVVHVIILALLLKSNDPSLSQLEIASTLALVLEDPKTKVRYCAIECLAVLNEIMVNSRQSLLSRLEPILSPNLISQLQIRFQDSRLPVLQKSVVVFPNTTAADPFNSSRSQTPISTSLGSRAPTPSTRAPPRSGRHESFMRKSPPRVPRSPPRVSRSPPNQRFFGGQFGDSRSTSPDVLREGGLKAMSPPSSRVHSPEVIMESRGWNPSETPKYGIIDRNRDRSPPSRFTFSRPISVSTTGAEPASAGTAGAEPASAPATRRAMPMASEYSEGRRAQTSRLQHMRSKMAGLKNKMKLRRGSSARQIRDIDAARTFPAANEPRKRGLLLNTFSELSTTPLETTPGSETSETAWSPPGGPRPSAPGGQGMSTLSVRPRLSLLKRASSESVHKREKAKTEPPVKVSSSGRRHTAHVARAKHSSSNDKKPPAGLDGTTHQSSRRPPRVPASRGDGTSGVHKAQEYADSQDLEPLDNPGLEMKRSMKGIKASEWNHRFKAMNNLRALAAHHASTIRPHAKEVCKEISRNIASLRSIESKNAILTVSDMFRFLKKDMDVGLDILVPQLLKRAGESSGFIRIEADKGLQQMLTSCTKSRVLVSLLSAFQGGGGKAKAMRQKCAEYTYKAVKTTGSRVSTFQKIDKLIKNMSIMLGEGSLVTRTAGKRLVFQLRSVLGEGDFVGRCSRVCTGAEMATLKRVLEKGEIPEEEPTGPSRPGTVKSHSRKASILGGKVRRMSRKDSQDGLVVEGSQAMRGTKDSGKRISGRRVSRNDTVDDANLKVIFNDIDSKQDWRTRISGMEALGKLCDTQPQVLRNCTVKIVDRLSQRLDDGNSKVNLVALNILRKLVPQVRSTTESQMRTNLVTSIASHVGASNPAVRKAASNVLDTYIAELDGCHLIQPLANATLFGKQAIRPLMLQKLLPLVNGMAQSNSSLIKKHLVPLTVQLLKATSADIRDGNRKLLRTLHSVMGSTLYNVPVVKRLSRSQLDRLKKQAES